MTTKRDHMLRAIALARRADGHTAPNPMVGCVLTKGADVIGEGYHAGPGTPHAEIMALQQAGNDAAGATAYVTLEPCNHTGNTPPCVDALIAAGVSDVIYAISDPNPIAAGGADRLKAAGIHVHAGLCEKEATELIRAWLRSTTHKRPFVTVKFAGSLDGRTATHKGDSKWITSNAARLRSHDLRQTADAIIIGVTTLINDDPMLTARPHQKTGQHAIKAAHPLRIVLDSKGRAPLDAKVFQPTTPGKTILACTKHIQPLKASAFKNRDIDVWSLPFAHDGRPCLLALLDKLHRKNIRHVMVEGGGTIAGRFLEMGLVDEVWAFLGPCLIGSSGKPAFLADGPDHLSDCTTLSDPVTELLDGTILIRGQTRRVEREAPCSPVS